MIGRLLCGTNMRRVLAICGIVALLVCIAPPISAGENANIVIATVKPTELLPGETRTLTLTLQNDGSYDARHITLNFQDTQYISVVGSSNVYAASIPAWCSKDVTITVHVAKGAPSGTYTIPVTCTFDQYYSEGGQAVTETMPEVSYSIALRVTQGAIIDIADVAPSELMPGEKTELQFTIANLGSFPLQDLVFSWTEPTGVILPVTSDNTKHIGYIDASASTVVSYMVVADVNAAAGLYQLDLTLEFDDESGGSRALTTTAGIVIGGGTNFDVTVSESTTSQVSFYVANTGNNPAYSVTVRIPEQDKFVVQGSTSSIVGDLDKGDYTIVSFQVTSTSASFAVPGAAQGGQAGQGAEEEQQRQRPTFAPRNASQSNSLLVAIDYTDATGLRQTVNKTVPVKLQTASSTGTTTGAEAGYYARRQQQSVWNNTTVIGALALIVFILAGVLYYRYRKKKRHTVNPALSSSVGPEKKQDDEAE
jgi:hypothetical protein